MSEPPPFDSYVVAILANAVVQTIKHPTPEDAVDVYEKILSAFQKRKTTKKAK
jgi:hypothetical protein